MRVRTRLARAGFGSSRSSRTATVGHTSVIVPENLRRDPLSIAVRVSPMSSRRTFRVWWEASSSRVHESGSAAPSLGFDKVETFTKTRRSWDTG